MTMRRTIAARLLVVARRELQAASNDECDALITETILGPNPDARLKREASARHFLVGALVAGVALWLDPHADAGSAGVDDDRRDSEPAPAADGGPADDHEAEAPVDGAGVEDGQAGKGSTDAHLRGVYYP